MKVFINADDFGLNEDVNNAIAMCFEKNYIQQTTIIVNMPSTDNAVNISKEKGFNSLVGLHLNLVSGCPLTEGIKRTWLCSDGIFNGTIMNGKNRFFINRKIRNVIIEEINAQIDKYLSYGFTLKHLDSHRHSHTNPSVLHLLIPISKRKGFDSIRLSRNLKSMGFVKDIFKKTENRIIVSFNKRKMTKYTDCYYFGTLSDFDMLSEFETIESTIELMVHPTMDKGIIRDSINEFGVGDWLELKRNSISEYMRKNAGFSD